MNKALILNWNAVVPRDGTIFVLGDMFWKSDLAERKNIMARLNGKKY